MKVEETDYLTQCRRGAIVGTRELVFPIEGNVGKIC